MDVRRNLGKKIFSVDIIYHAIADFMVPPKWNIQFCPGRSNLSLFVASIVFRLPLSLLDGLHGRYDFIIIYIYCEYTEHLHINFHDDDEATIGN
jgi:hypothetical protein